MSKSVGRIFLENIFKDIRIQKKLSLKEVSDKTQISVSLLSRIENGKRIPTKKQAIKLARFYNLPEDEILADWLGNKIVKEIRKESFGLKALKIAEQKVSYDATLFEDVSFPNAFKLSSRRYIGSKTQLVDWIFQKIIEETENSNSFFDVFAGTGVVAQRALNLFEEVALNDILYSNEIIYIAFFENSYWDKYKVIELVNFYNEIEPSTIEENYFSIHFGNKYFDNDTAKKIGFIREDLEKRKSSLTRKEFAILLASLIYSMDKVANTVGHFDAYIKKEIHPKRFKLNLIQAENFSNVKIYREDANNLVRKIQGDIAYIDPPYNSRQYSRFYHIYENLVTWRKPELFGVALKPSPQNMSKYCTVEAKNVFKDLINNLNFRFIAVSYNNTYNSKSNSSKNKIQLEEILSILKERGETKIFEQPHRFFNTGKTNFNNHKEFLFLTKVND